MKSVREFYEALKTAIATESPSTSVLFGIEWFNRRDGQGAFTADRVAVAPHKPDGTRGTFLPPSMQPYLAPPSLGIHRRWVAIECWGYDGSAPTDRGRQDDALEWLIQMVWRHSQAIIRSAYHVTPGAVGGVPGFYQVEEVAQPSPTERVHGARAIMTFWIDFAVRDIAPTSLEEPDLSVTATMEQQ